MKERGGETQKHRQKDKERETEIKMQNRDRNRWTHTNAQRKNKQKDRQIHTSIASNPRRRVEYGKGGERRGGAKGR